MLEHLNPKVRNGAIAVLGIAIIEILNAIINEYPDQAWTPILAAIIPVVVGYFTPQGDWKSKEVSA